MPCVRVSAPGSLMMTGEHAVLHGYKAAACAIDKRIYLKLKTTDDSLLKIKSPLGDLAADMDNLPTGSQFNFIVEAIRQSGIKNGLKIETESEFSHKVGLGSSAAVTVCICKALNYVLENDLSNNDFFKKCYSVVHGVQRTGSGSDLAASIFGGIIEMQKRGCDFIPRKLNCPVLPQIDLFYCGYKMKTPDVIALVNSKAEADPERYKELYNQMGLISNATIQALELGDIALTGKLFDKYQILMENLGVCDDAISDILHQIRRADGIYGAKISGSGLGDCVMSLGIPDKKPVGYLNIPVSISKDGVLLC